MSKVVHDVHHHPWLVDDLLQLLQLGNASDVIPWQGFAPLCDHISHAVCVGSKHHVQHMLHKYGT